jgi:hypothetical protein
MEEKVTRRGVALMLGSLGLSPAQAQTQKAGASIRREADFKTTPRRIYEALLDAKQFSAVTKGYPVGHRNARV